MSIEKNRINFKNWVLKKGSENLITALTQLMISFSYIVDLNKNLKANPKRTKLAHQWYIEVKNKSGIDFEINYLNVYRTNGNKKRIASYQKLQQEVIYRYKLPYSIADEKHQRFIYVLPKFVLGANEKLMLELKEMNGSRKVVLVSRL